MNIRLHDFQDLTAEAVCITNRSKCMQAIDVELNFGLRTLHCQLLLGGIKSIKGG